MSAIGNVIDKAVDAAVGSSSGTTLQDFLSNFSSSSGILAKTIDPIATFDITMELHPTMATAENNNGGWASKLAGSLVSSAKSAVNNAINNATGGLVGALINSGNKNLDVTKKHNTFEYYGKETFLEYLAAAHMLVGDEGWLGENAGQTVRPLTLQLGLYCQEVTIPNLDVPQAGTSTNALGEFPINGPIVKTDGAVLVLKLLNTVAPLHERLFYPWLRETTLPFWSYDTQPYTTATITVDFSKHSDTAYVFYGCRPSKINMMQGHHDPSAQMTRDVSFLFDYMLVKSKLTTYESVESKLFDAGKKLAGSAMKMINA